MADFEKSYKIVKANEGGYANNSADRGGETYKGIARKIWSGWQGWKIIDAYRLKPGFPGNLESDADLQRMVRAFFKENFWNALSLDNAIDQDISTELFDTGVNMGVGMAALFLQRVLNACNRNGQDYADLALDGRIGAVTIGVLNRHKRPKQILKLLNCLQGARYIDICERDHSQEIFMTGWSERVA